MQIRTSKNCQKCLRSKNGHTRNCKRFKRRTKTKLPWSGWGYHYTLSSNGNWSS